MIKCRSITKNIRKTQYIIFCITFILLFISLVSSYFESSRQSILELNNEKSNNYIIINFTHDAKNDQIIKALNNLKKLDNIIIRHMYGMSFEPETMGEGIYFNNKFTGGYNQLEGRFLNADDFKDNRKVTVVGKDVLDKTKIENGKRYIYRGLDKYEVLGIIGKKDVSTRYDSLILYNFNCELNENETFNKVDLIIDSTSKNESELLQLVDVINSSYNDKIIEVKQKQPQLNPLNDALRSTGFIAMNFLLVTGCILLSLIKAIMLWLDNIKLEIGVRKAFGASNREIRFNISKRYIIVSLFSIVLSLIIQKLLLIFRILELEYYELSFINLISCLISVLLIGMFFILVAMKKINKMQPNELLKGN